MSETTPNLQMPYILPSQAQKHVTHNEALQRLDALTQLTIEARLSSPPSGPVEGACFEIAAAPTGDWSGRTGRIAVWQDGAWTFLTPRTGWRAVFLTDGRLRLHDGTSFALYDAVAGLDRLGINTAADSINRLAVSADATLLNHAGHGHQLKINKAASADTASLLFQSNWSGRAEMGLNGTDDVAIKVSPDGEVWHDALRIDGNGHVFQPQKPLARVAPEAGTRTPADGGRSGFAGFKVVQGGFALGSAVSGGGLALIAPATAAYLVTLRVEAEPAAAFSLSVETGTETIATVRHMSGTSAKQGYMVTGLAMLTAGAELHLAHTGNAAITFGYDRTEVLIAML